MTGYREKDSLMEKFWPADRWTLPYIAARLGFGFLAIGPFLFLTGGPLGWSAIITVVGALLLAWGLRNY